MTIEQTLGMIIGDLVIKNASLTVQIEGLQSQIKELESKPEKRKPNSASASKAANTEG